MALMDVPPSVMRPTALSLNILVATIGTVRWYTAGHFVWRTLWPFAVASVPLAFIGGRITLPIGIYEQVLGVVLFFAAYRLIRPVEPGQRLAVRHAPLPAALALGAVIGLLSGLVGVGGGIFLTPLLLLAGWAETRQAAAVTAAFILVNSTAGLMGYVSAQGRLASPVLLWAVAASAGGFLGSTLGSRRLAPITLRRLLAVVLVIAGGKLILT